MGAQFVHMAGPVAAKATLHKLTPTNQFRSYCNASAQTALILAPFTNPAMETVMAEASQDRARDTELGSRIGDLKDAALDQIEKASAQAGRITASVADQARDAGEKVQEVASTVDAGVRQSLKDQPMAMLAAAAALGFVLGALWKSR